MQYFIIENGAQAGPFTPEELVNTKLITAETLVWTDGLKDWTPAWQIEEIRLAMETRTNSQQTPPPVPPTMQVTSAQNKEQMPKKSHKTFWYSILAIVLVCLLVLMVSNPNKQDHKEAIKTEVTTAITKLADRNNQDNDIFSMGLKMLTNLFASSTVDATLDQILNYHNYLICSSTDVTFDGEQHKVSYGILGHVFTLNADDVVRSYEAVNQNGQKNSSMDNTDQKSVNDSEDVENSIDKTISKDADKLVDKVSKKVEDKINEELNKKLDEVSDSTENVIDKIIKVLGL